MTTTIEELRSQHRRKRRQLEESVLADHADKLAKRFTALAEFKAAEHIAAYIAILGEISVEAVMHIGAAQGKTFYLPVLRGQAMFFSPWQIDTPLIEKKFGLLEPDSSESDWIKPAELDLVIAPLVVFDERGNRIGQGGGFYDRTFEFTRDTTSDKKKPYLIGVAHDSQKEPQLQPQPWDIPLDKIVTEQAVYSVE